MSKNIQSNANGRVWVSIAPVSVDLVAPLLHTKLGLTWLERQPFVRVIELNLIDPLWKLVPERPELTTFNVFRDPLILINGTFELLVSKQ